MRTRNVVRQSPHRVTGKFASAKNGRAIQLESRLERDAICLLETDHRAVRFREQPAVVKYRVNGELHEYYPDLRVERARSKDIIEVKPFDEAQRPENQERFAEIARVLEADGFGFVVWTEKEIRPQPRLDNTKYLLKFRRAPYEDAQVARVCDLLKCNGDMRFSQTLELLVGAITKPALLAMVCHGLFAIDHAEPIGPNTLITVIQKGAES